MRAVIAFLPLISAGCRQVESGFGAGAHARTSVDQFYGALANRHLEIVRNAKYEYARVQLSRGALSPSRVYDDTAAWTASSGAVRVLETFGTHTDDKYVMSSHRNVPAPTKPADGRHVTTLSRVSDGEYQWDTTVDFALGSIRPADLALVISRLMAAGEGLTDKDARAEIAAAAPRSSAVLGMLFSLDTIHPVALGDGSTLVTLGIGVHSDQLRQKMPAYGEYVRKYMDTARLRFVLTDRSGAPFLDAQGHDRFLSIKLRTVGGHLVPLAGPPRPMPDTLVILADFTTKVKLWHVGFHDLSLDFVNSARGDTERDWTVTGHREPHWNLPFITARLIRAPLRRPFAGEGALFRLGVRAGTGDEPTVLVRQSRLVVQESAILRFINSLTSTAMDDFGVRAEREENQWLRELFIAMREDAHALLGER